MKLPTLKKNNPLFWLYIVCGVLILVLSIILAPMWGKVEWAFWKNWGNTFLKLAIGIILACYLFGFLLKKIIRTKRQSILILTIIEFAILFLIDLYLILGNFGLFPNIFHTNDCCGVLGIALYFRGVVEIFRAYYYKRESEEKYPIWWLCIAILFVTFGLWMCIKPFITDNILLWIFAGGLFALSCCAIAYGIYAAPRKHKSKK